MGAGRDSSPRFVAGEASDRIVDLKVHVEEELARAVFQNASDSEHRGGPSEGGGGGLHPNEGTERTRRTDVIQRTKNNSITTSRQKFVNSEMLFFCTPHAAVSNLPSQTHIPKSPQIHTHTCLHVHMCTSAFTTRLYTVKGQKKKMALVTQTNYMVNESIYLQSICVDACIGTAAAGRTVPLQYSVTQKSIARRNLINCNTGIGQRQK